MIHNEPFFVCFVQNNLGKYFYFSGGVKISTLDQLFVALDAQQECKIILSAVHLDHQI